MRKIVLLIFCLYLGGLIVSGAIDKVEENVFKLSSNELIHNGQLPNAQVLNAYGCSGGNVSPQLSWNTPPINTKSFALICHDPDAPRENGWYHWLILNIPVSIKEIKEGEKIQYFQTKTDFETMGYGGACPPIGHGIHHYNFTLYALDIETLDVDKNEQPKIVEDLVKSHMIESATITALYSRN